MKKQVICVHGGDAYENYEDYLTWLKSYELTLEALKKQGWKSKLQKELGDVYDVILPQMPCGFNAKYLEWKIWFDKIVPFVEEDVILIGHSMGGIFLAKYLSENLLKKRIAAAILVAAPFDEKDCLDKLMDFNLPESLKNFEKQVGKIILMQSEDDPVVPFADLAKYEKLLPAAEVLKFKNKGHFTGEEFPELVEIIKNI